MLNGDPCFWLFCIVCALQSAKFPTVLVLVAHLLVVQRYTVACIPATLLDQCPFLFRLLRAMDASLFRAFLQERDYSSGLDIMQHACSHGGYALQIVEFFMALRADQRHYQTFGDVQQMLTDMKETGKGLPWFNQLCQVSYNLYLLLHKQWKPHTKRSSAKADVPMSRAARRKLSYTGLCLYSAPSLS